MKKIAISSSLFTLLFLFVQFASVACGYPPSKLRTLIAQADAIVGVTFDSSATTHINKLKPEHNLKGTYTADFLPNQSFDFYELSGNQKPVYGIIFLEKGKDNTRYFPSKASNSSMLFYSKEEAELAIKRIREMVAIQTMKASKERDIKTLTWLVEGLEASKLNQEKWFSPSAQQHNEMIHDLLDISRGIIVPRYTYLPLTKETKKLLKVDFKHITPELKKRIYANYQQYQKPSNTFTDLVVRCGFEKKISQTVSQ